MTVKRQRMLLQWPQLRLAVQTRFSGRAILAVKYTTKLFQKPRRFRMPSRVHMSSGMILLSIGKIQDKLRGFFDSLQTIVGGSFNKEALMRVLRSLLKTVVDLAEKIFAYVSGVLPGGKSVKLMLTTLNGTVGSYFVANRVDKMLKHRDTDQDGDIDYNEFEAAALTRDSLIRKALSWVDRKTSVMRGERENETTGKISVKGDQVWARVVETNVEAEQFLEYWTTREEIGNGRSRLGRISLQEPCAIDDGDNEDDNKFVVIDHTKTKWTIECEDRESFFDWFDAVDDMCDAKLDADDLEHDGHISALCPTVTKIFR